MAFLAMGIEVVQHFFTTRELSFIDFVAGLAGIFAFIAMLKVVAKRYVGFDEPSKERAWNNFDNWRRFFVRLQDVPTGA